MSTEHFLPFDLENTFSSAFVLIVASVVLPSSFSGQVMVGELEYRNAAFSILDDIIYRGSVPAKHRKRDLEQLDQMAVSIRQKERLHISTRQSTKTIDKGTDPQDLNNPSAIGSSVEEIKAGWQLSCNNPYTWQPAQMDSIAQALGSYSGGADMNDFSMDQWLWNDTGPEMSI